MVWASVLRSGQREVVGMLRGTHILRTTGGHNARDVSDHTSGAGAPNSVRSPWVGCQADRGSRAQAGRD